MSYETPVPSFEEHSGFTLEVGGGVGLLRVPRHVTGAGSSLGGVATGLDITVGGFFTQQVAVGWRLAGASASFDWPTGSSDRTGVVLMLGASVQYWPTPRYWLAGGFGVLAYGQVGKTPCDSCGAYGFGGELRAGWTLGLNEHSIQVFVQAVPGYVSGFVLSAAVGAGYQYL